MKKSSFKTIKIRTNYFDFFFFVFIDLFLTFGQKILLFRLLSLKPMINSKKYIHNENLRKIQEKRTTIYTKILQKNLGRSERTSFVAWRVDVSIHFEPSDIDLSHVEQSSGFWQKNIIVCLWVHGND